MLALNMLSSLNKDIIIIIIIIINVTVCENIRLFTVYEIACERGRFCGVACQYLRLYENESI